MNFISLESEDLLFPSGPVIKWLLYTIHTEYTMNTVSYLGHSMHPNFSHF